MSKIFISIRKKAGITLTEVLFAALILTLVLVGSLLVLTQTVDISKRVDYEYEAINIAKNRLEEARTTVDTGGFDSLSTDLTETATELDTDDDGTVDFKRKTQVSENYSGNPRLTKVDVTVTYKYRGVWKQDASIVMKTIFVNTD